MHYTIYNNISINNRNNLIYLFPLNHWYFTQKSSHIYFNFEEGRHLKEKINLIKNFHHFFFWKNFHHFKRKEIIIFFSLNKLILKKNQQ